MTFSEAKREFEIRYYLWATSEFEREIECSFPSFQLFKSGKVWETLQYMRLLDRSRQRTLAHALLKRFHPNAVAALGEVTSAEELSLRSARDTFGSLRNTYGFILMLESAGQMAEARYFLNQIKGTSLDLLINDPCGDAATFRADLDFLLGSIPRSLEDEIALRKKAGEKLKFISKRKLLKLMAEQFQKAFAGQCLETVREEVFDPNLGFDMKCAGWVVSTHFWFGRSSALLNYSHTIESEASYQHLGPSGAYMAPLVMETGISFSSWLGITSQVQWECLTDEEVEPACAAALKLCAHFFDVLPKLLKGLEGESVTFDGADIRGL